MDIILYGESRLNVTEAVTFRTELTPWPERGNPVILDGYDFSSLPRSAEASASGLGEGTHDTCLLSPNTSS
jgi:hypothetical protein